MHVLLIEDDPSCVDLIRKLLTQIATEVNFTVAASGEEVALLLQKWARHSGGEGLPPPEVIILDLGLPGMGGLEVLSNLRANRVTRKAPIMVFTSSESEEDRSRAYASGAMRYVVKPQDPKNYKERVLAIHEDAMIYQVITKKFDFTTREAAVAISLCRGESTEEAAKQLFIAPATLRAHLRNVFQKAGIKSRMELVSNVLSLLVRKLAAAQAALHKYESVQQQTEPDSTQTLEAAPASVL